MTRVAAVALALTLLAAPAAGENFHDPSAPTWRDLELLEWSMRQLHEKMREDSAEERRRFEEDVRNDRFWRCLKRASNHEERLRC